MGIDVARGIAVLGMFVVHVGVGWEAADGSNALYPVVSGRSAALFALLAGVSIALLSGGSAPKQGKDMGVALWRVVIRGLIMLPLGTALTMLGTGVSVILAYYALFFVLAAPLLWERWKIVAGTAAVLAFAGPVVSFWLRGLATGRGSLAGPVRAVDAYDPLVGWSGEGVVDFLLTGAYPALTWMPFVLAGLAIGRLDLRAVRVRWALVGVGAVLAAAAYGAAWVALSVGGVRERLAGSFTGGIVERYGGQGLDETLSRGLPGTLPVNDWAWLVTAAPHGGSPLEIVGAGGVAMVVLGVCLLVADRLWVVLYPLAAVGALALTTYVGHVVLIWAAERGVFEGTVLWWLTSDLAVSVLVGSLVFATVWRLLVRRGPLEGPLHAVSLWAAKRIP
ncbi:putative membrane protein YeiB [Murinocardiopsis flavida]|uniref:Putative membrane protein YeiB n=2 Tax=Murinocardiopsis flavida TaxID=645275 RepID=A0A2P8DP06_9ACTN|nr:putative membrane protein YeiB [Murinocardiopsis flavida]